MSEHDQLEPFFDGALSAAEAAAFKQHLAACATCADRLGELVYLQSLQHDQAAEARKVVPIASRRRAWKIAAVAAPLAVAAAAVLVFRADRPPAPEVSLAGERLLEARLGWEPAERYRPFGAVRGEDASEPGLVPVIEGLISAGDHRGAAAAWLLAGAPERARSELARAGDDDSDAEATAAAILLVEGEPREALARADAALAQNRKHAAARWNRALALRDLELPLLAAQAFAAVVELGEPGWAAEAGKRREALVAPLREAQQRATPFSGDPRLERARQSLASKDLQAALSEARAVRAEARSLGEYARETAAIAVIAEALASQDDAGLAALFKAELAARATLP